MLLSPQAERNWEAISLALEDVLEEQSHRQLFALELGSGTGQHVIRFAQRMPFVTWQPSDISEEFRESSWDHALSITAGANQRRGNIQLISFSLKSAQIIPKLQSIKAYIAATQAKTVLPPVHLDASEPWEKWAGLPRSSCDVVLAINLLQYSSFKTAQGVFIGAGQILKENGLLITHGVYAVNGIITPSCNERVDEELRKKNPEWGLPDVDVLRQIAYENGLRLERMIEMEEYYKCLVFRKLQ